MSNELENSSFIDQIVSRTFTMLSERDEFDEGTLDRIEQLLRSDSTTNYENVVDALIADEEKAL